MKGIERRLEQLERDTRGKDVYIVVMPGDPIPDLPKHAHGIVITYGERGERVPGLPDGITQVTFPLVYARV